MTICIKEWRQSGPQSGRINLVSELEVQGGSFYTYIIKFIASSLIHT